MEETFGDTTEMQLGSQWHVDDLLNTQKCDDAVMISGNSLHPPLFHIGGVRDCSGFMCLNC